MLQTGKHTVTALTRGSSTSSLPSGVQVAQVDYEDESSLVSALLGQEILIICLAATAAPDTHDKIVVAAAKAGVPRIMPNTWGAALEYPKLEKESILGATYLANVRKIEELGLAWTSLCSSFWYEFSLAAQPDGYGFDMKNRKVTFYDDGEAKINTTTWKQCARAVAAWLSLKALPKVASDISPTVSSWTNKSIYISSFLVSQKDMLASVKRVQGGGVEWDISHEGARERHQRGMGMVQKGDMSGFVVALYASAFIPGRFGDFETPRGGKLDNEVLGLPEEKLDEATSRALGMVGGV